jgi:hypothetical protein
VAACRSWPASSFLVDSRPIYLLQELAAGLPTIKKDGIHQFLSEYIALEQCFTALRLEISMP